MRWGIMPGLLEEIKQNPEILKDLQFWNSPPSPNPISLLDANPARHLNTCLNVNVLKSH